MKNVLIVDDAAFMRMSIKMTLQKHGFNVVGEADNGKVAVEKYLELRPDLVTMDITMPEMTGIEALKEIVKNDPQANVIMVSAMGQEMLVKEAIISGAKSFVVKPFTEDTLIKVLDKFK
ncbi:MAG: response regulator [Clostridiales bacterium]|nr:response regulator [Clostridiales bacterium]